MHMLVRVLQNRLKPIWPSLYHQLKVASHQDAPSTASTSAAGGRDSPQGPPSPARCRSGGRGGALSPPQNAHTHALGQPARLWVTQRGARPAGESHTAWGHLPRHTDMAALMQTALFLKPEQLKLALRLEVALERSLKLVSGCIGWTCKSRSRCWSYIHAVKPI